MDIFCKECAARPKWAFDDKKAFVHSCQRCFRHLPCNDYTKPHAHPPVAAPKPKDLVPEGTHVDIALPRAKMDNFAKAALSVEDLAKLEEKEAADKVAYDEKHGEAKVEAVNELPHYPVADAAPFDAEKMLDAVQPNRPGIKLTPKGKVK